MLSSQRDNTNISGDPIESINVLNIDEELSTASIKDIISNSDIDDEYILSDADEELLILIKFKEQINLKSITLYASSNVDTVEDEEVSPPKQVHIYKLNHLNINFDDLSSLKPDKSIKCSNKKISKGQKINLRKTSQNVLKFNKIQYLGIHIQSNQSDCDKTILSSIVIDHQSNDLKQNQKQNQTQNQTQNQNQNQNNTQQSSETKENESSLNYNDLIGLLSNISDPSKPSTNAVNDIDSTIDELWKLSYVCICSKKFAAI